MGMGSYAKPNMDMEMNSKRLVQILILYSLNTTRSTYSYKYQLLYSRMTVFV